MHETAIVRGLERGGNLCAESQRVGDREWSLTNQIGERLSADQFHDQAAALAEFREFVKSGDVRVVDRRQDTRFAAEPRQAVRVFTKIGVNELDGDVSIERAIACPVHLAHASGAEKSDDFVVAEAHTWSEPHGSLADYRWLASRVSYLPGIR